MRRRVPLVLCVLFSVSTVMLWVMSYWQAPGVVWSGPDRFIKVAIYRGSVQAAVWRPHRGVGHYPFHWEVVMLGGRLSFRLMRPPDYTWPWKRWGLTWRNLQVLRLQEAHFGAWIPAAIFGAAAYVLARPLLRARHRRREGRCMTCGYDLTGNESGVCPECGTAVE